MCLCAKHGQLSSSRSMATMWRAGHRGANLNSSGHPQCSNFEFTSGRQSEDVLNGVQRVLRVCMSAAGGENFPINSRACPVVSSVVPCCSAVNGLGGLNRVVTSKAAAEIQVPVHYCCMINRWGHGEWPTPLLEWYRIISTCVAYWGHRTRSPK